MKPLVCKSVATKFTVAVGKADEFRCEIDAFKQPAIA
jgi:hypothetical protein